MSDYNKAGGIAALLHAAAYLVAIGFYLWALSPIIDADPVRYLALLPAHQGVMHAWILIAYWLPALCLVVVSLAFHDRLQSDRPLLVQTTTVLGLVWAGLIIASGNLMLHDFGEIARLHARDPAQAETVWLALKTVETGLVSGNELIGGLWVGLASWAALRAGWLPRVLNVLGLLLGLVGIASIIPLSADAVIVFGPGMIVWFAWAGVALLRHGNRLKGSRRPATA